MSQTSSGGASYNVRSAMPMTELPDPDPVVPDDVVSPALAYDLGMDASRRAKVDALLDDLLTGGSRQRPWREPPPPRLPLLPGR